MEFAALISAEQIKGIIRTLGASTVTYFIARGWLTPEGGELALAVVVALGSGAWSFASNRVAGRAIAPEQIAGLLRTVGGSLATFAIAKGWIAPADAEWLLSGALAIGAAVWSVWSKRPAKALR